MSVVDNILNLSRQLYPRARSFKMPFGGTFQKMHEALAISEARAYSDGLSILDAILPDNDNFTEDDASDWERRLGIYSSGAVSLADRKAAIKRKINHPGTIKARQNWLYIQEQLRAAGFDVYVYENLFEESPLGSPPAGYVNKKPYQIIGSIAGAAVHSPIVRHGAVRHKSSYRNFVANDVDEALDRTFMIGSSYMFTFYIAGATIDTFADVDEFRKNEFRQLILQLKPAHMVGILFVNYV